MNELLPYSKDLVTRLHNAESKLRTKVYEAIGAGSACWDNLAGAGVFKSEEAIEIGDELIHDILEITGFGELSLGCATNKQLEDELRTRREMGNEDPNYRTADG